MVELKPCPFCGSYNVKVHIPYFTDGCYMVQCYGCHCNTAIHMTVDKAVEAWNKRDDVNKKKLSCHFEHCKDCLSLIKFGVFTQAEILLEDTISLQTK